MNIHKYPTPHNEGTGEAMLVTAEYIRELRRECKEWRLRCLEAEKTIATLKGRVKADARRKISSVLVNQGARPVKFGESR